MPREAPVIRATGAGAGGEEAEVKQERRQQDRRELKQNLKS